MSSPSFPGEQETKPAGKHLIVNADDFGMSPGINQGIVTAFNPPQPRELTGFWI